MVKKRIGFVGLILLIVVGFDVLVGAVSGTLIKNVPDVGVNQTNTAQALFSRDADVLILGSSRANHSFDCRIMKDSLKMSCYNAGRDGQNIIYDAIVFFSYVERHVPKILILDIASAMMDNSWFDNLHEMNCYYGLSNPLDSIIEENATWTDRLKLKSNLYRYNNTWQWLLNAYMAESKEDLDGYRPMPVNATNPFKASFKQNDTFVADKKCVVYLDRIKDFCKIKNVRFILTYSPSLVVSRKGGIEEWVDCYAKGNNLEYYDYGNDSFFYEKPEWFYDMTHLNAIGATEFTKRFVNTIKKDLVQ